MYQRHLHHSMMRSEVKRLRPWLLVFLLAGCEGQNVAPIRDSKLIAELQRIAQRGCFRGVEEMVILMISSHAHHGHLDEMLRDKDQYPNLDKFYVETRAKMLARWAARPTPRPDTVVESMQLHFTR